MRHILGIVVLVVFVAACGAHVDEPKLEGLVNDKVGLLGAEDIREIDDKLSSYEKQTCHQVVVLVVDSTNGESIDSFSLKTANRWGIGYKGLNNGVLVTIAVNDRHLRVEVGNGLNKYLTDEEAARIIEHDIVPEFKAGNFTLGVKQGLNSIMKAAARYEIPDNQRPEICSRV